MTQQSFLNQVKEGAIQGWHKYKVLPSITAAQACLESGWGQSGLAKSPNYNLFGIKSSADWSGPSVNYKTQEWSATKGYYYVYADFRVYSSWNESIEQHGAFFTNTEWRKNNYRKVIGERNYKTAAQELKNAGYATDPGYPPKLINIIEQYNLQEWDREAFAGGNGGSSADTPISTITAEPRIVGGSITTQATNDTSKRSITVIGDSLGVGTEPYLKNYTWKSANYNNYGSRQWTHSQAVYDGLVQLQSFINAGTLNDYVVMILGTNRGVNSSEIQRAVNMIGSNRKLLLVDTDSQVGHKDSVASAYMLASETYANVFYVNWSHTALSSYYGSDKIHMTSAGYKAHAEFIVQAVYEVANTNWSNEPSKIVTESNKVVTDIKNINYQDDIFVSPNGESIIYNKTLNDQFGFRPKSGQVLWIERILKVNSDNEKEMLEEGLAYMREHSQPATQYTVSLRELPDTVSIGDVGIFVDHEFNPPLAIEARVLNITTSQSNPNNNTVTIGNVKELYPQSKDDIIAIQKQLQETREDLLDEFYKGEPLDIVIEGTSGLILSGERSKFRTELIIGPTTNLELTGEGSHTIELYGAQKTDNEFRFSGKLTNALIFEEVDEAFKYIVENTESDAVIDDPSQNPQGIDIPNPLQPVDMKTLDIQDFTVEFLDGLGQVVLTDTIPIYDDGQFNYPIVGFEKNIRKIRILHDKDMNFATISFTEREANRATINSTQLVARVYQGNREVTERFDNFSWVRVSNHSREDEGWNDKNKFVQSNHITVYADDIEDNESTFVVRLFDNDFERIVVSSSAIVKVNVEGKSAYELAVEAGFEGTLDEWVASLRGADGTNGVEGPKGEDGQSTYIHVAWADSPMGDGFSTSDSTDKEYMGTYVDEIEADSDNYLDYKWMKVKGEKGEPGEQGPRGLQGLEGPEGKQGIEGEKGADGKSSYTHIAYATGDQGQSFSHDTFPQATHIGMYVSNNQNSSDNWRDYKWTLIKGADGARGLEGPKGADGRTPYFHTAWANSADGSSGFSTTVSAGKLYLGTVTTFEPDDPTDYRKYSWTLIKGDKGDPGATGKDGVAGKDGVGISKTTILYGVSTSETTQPSSWSSTVPTLVKGQYLWTKTEWTYTDSSKEVGYTKSYIAKDGNDGNNGLPGKDGVGIKSTSIHYGKSTSGTSHSGITWSTTVPSVPNGQYLWTRTTWTYDDNTTETGYSVAKMGDTGPRGEQGPRGPQGVPGQKGADGVTTYTWIRYATTPTSGMSNDPTGKDYIGFAYNQPTATESNIYSDYTWSLIKGPTGNTGATGPKGADGQTTYTWIKYSANANGSGMTDTPQSNTKYIGIAVNKTTPTESNTASDYTWSLFKGDKGDPGASGKDGVPGKDGVGIKSTTITYGVSANETTQPATYTTTVPTLVKGQYLWTKTVWVYTDNTTETGYTKTYIPKDGNNGTNGIAGKDGVGITKTTITYAKSTSGTTPPTTGYTATVPSANPGEYIWTKTVWTYTDNTNETGYSVGKIGNTGATGARGPQGATGSQGPKGDTGTSVSSVTEYYLATSANTGVTTSTSGWTTTIQTMTATNKYLWNYEKINFSDNTSQPTIPVIIGAYGDKGQTGSTGATGRSITGITEYYLATSASSGVTRSTSGWSTTMKQTTPTNKYLWNYERITWSSGTTTTYVEPIIIGVHGDKGDTGPRGPQGIQGPAGSNGQSQWVHIRYSANSNGSSMTTSPSSTTKYVGIAVTNSSTAPAYTGFTWSKYVGENGSTGARGPQGLPGTNGTDGKTTYTWVRYADTPTSGMNQYPDGKKYIGLAFNKTTQTESSNYNDYQWSLMPQNIEIGAKTQDELENISHIYFDNDGYIEFPDEAKNLVHGGTEATIEFWNKQDSLSYGLLQLSGFADTNGNLYPYQNYTTVYLDVFRTNRLGPITMSKPVDRWHHFAITTHPKEGWKLYQDGALIYTASAQSTVNTSYLKFRVGNNSGNRYSNAGYRDIRLWNKARTHQEIITNMNQDVTESESGLVGYWKVNEGSGESVTDLVNGNNGVIVNGSWRGIENKLDDKANNSDLTSTIQTITEESEKIASLRTDVDITKNNFLITHTDEYVNKITTTESSVDGLDKRVVSVEETKENIDTFFQFDDAFTIGKSNAQTKLRLTNDEIQFLDGETKGTYITGNTMVSQNIQIQDGFNLPKHTMETEGDITVIRFTG